MKRILSLVLVALLVFSLAACGSSSEATTTKERTKKTVQLAKIEDKNKGQFRVGFSRSIITPTDINVPLTGYGNEAHRIANGYLTELTTDATVISDENNNTVIIIQLDLINNSNSAVATDLFQRVSKMTGVPVDNIITNCSHTHSGPAIGSTGMQSILCYNEFWTQVVCDNVVKAMNDRLPAKKMYYGETETYQCNFVRHYLADDGKGDVRAMGDNHWDIWWSDVSSNPGANIKHISEIDPTLYMVKFQREGGKDVIIGSFRAHNTQTGGSTKYVMSADWVGKFRDYVEENIGNCNCMYLQGNAGNVNPSSRIEEDNYTRDYIETANRIGKYASQIMENLTEIKTGKVAASKFTVTCPTNKQNLNLLPQANLVQAYWKKSNDSTETKRYAYTLGIVSQYAASGIISASKRGNSMDITSSVMVIGDLAITFAPGEMFCDLGHLMLEKSPYKYTIPVSYSGYTIGYIPTSQAFDYGCYETDTCPEGKGSGEMLIEEYAKQLTEIKNNTK